MITALALEAVLPELSPSASLAQEDEVKHSESFRIQAWKGPFRVTSPVLEAITRMVVSLACTLQNQHHLICQLSHTTRTHRESQDFTSYQACHPARGP